jgi:hypothetical protein
MILNMNTSLPTECNIFLYCFYHCLEIESNVQQVGSFLHFFEEQQNIDWIGHLIEWYWGRCIYYSLCCTSRKHYPHFTQARHFFLFVVCLLLLLKFFIIPNSRLVLLFFELYNYKSNNLRSCVLMNYDILKDVIAIKSQSLDIRLFDRHLTTTKHFVTSTIRTTISTEHLPLNATVSGISSRKFWEFFQKTENPSYSRTFHLFTSNTRNSFDTLIHMKAPTYSTNLM